MSDNSEPSASSSAHSNTSASSFCSSSSGVSSSSSLVSSSVLVLCENCREVSTDVCLAEGKHEKQKLSNLEEAVVRQTEKINKGFNNLKNTSKTCRNIKRKTTKARKQCSETYAEVKENTERHYGELWDLLHQNREQALNLLEAERETLHRSLSLFDYQQTLTHIQETIQQLENQQTTGQQTRLDEIKMLQERLENMEKFIAALEEEIECNDNAQRLFDGTRFRALEESVKMIVQKNSKLMPQPWEFSDAVTFHNGKMHDALKFCEKRMQLFLQNSTSNQTNRRTTTWFSAVATQSFSKGQHYWEVEGSQSWAVGIVEKNWRVENGENQLNHPLGRDRASWALECDEGDLAALHSDEISAVDRCSVRRLGVCVDCDEGKLKFYDVNSAKLLHVFFIRFSSSVHPAFSLRHTGHKKNSSLTICKLFPSSENKYLEDHEED